MATPAVAFKGFTKISPNVWYLAPLEKAPRTNGAISTPNKQPDLVIIATWLNAAPKHIAKYLLGYQTVYSHSSLLLITNTVADVSYRPDRLQMRRLAPAMAIIEKLKSGSQSHESQSPTSRILLHAFSNGGSHQARLLAQMYRHKYGTPLPGYGMVLDSCPGSDSYSAGLKALSIGVTRFWPLRMLILGAIHLLLSTFWVLHRLLPTRKFLQGLRIDLNDPSLFPLCPRLYIYSKGDEMVFWYDVEAHAAEAMKKGWDVRLGMFEGSKHVSHLMVNPQQYWKLVVGVAS